LGFFHTNNNDEFNTIQVSELCKSKTFKSCLYLHLHASISLTPGLQKLCRQRLAFTFAMAELLLSAKCHLSPLGTLSKMHKPKTMCSNCHA